MAIKHNQKIVNNHFRKDWQRRVRTHFDQVCEDNSAVRIDEKRDRGN
jgi:hypothetical protein